MRALLILLTLVSAATLARAQKADKKLTESEVPAAVLAAQAKAYAGIAVAKWELHAGKSPKKGSHYTAQFTDATGKKVHTRFDDAGTLTGRSTYFDQQHIPAVVATAATSRYAAYKITEAEQVENIKKQMTWFEVRLKGEPGKKTVKMDLQGKEIPKEKAGAGEDDGQ